MAGLPLTQNLCAAFWTFRGLVHPRLCTKPQKYFKKALEVFGYDVPFQFRWVGYMKDAKNEENTGKDALNKAVQFLIGRNLPIKNVCLFDCDTSRSETVRNNVYTRVIPTYANSKRMKKGIENALVLDSIDVSPYYSSKVKEGDYGDDNTIVEFQKMDFCDYICSLDSETLKVVFANLKTSIDGVVPSQRHAAMPSNGVCKCDIVW